MGVTTFNQLHGTLYRNFTWRDDRVKMVWHDDEFVQFEFPILPISRERIDKKLGQFVGVKETATVPGLSRYKIRSEIVSSMWDQECSSGLKSEAIVARATQREG
jgi:hypothetical protein